MAALVLVAALTGCARRDDDRRAVLDAIAATRQVPARYVYTDQRPDRQMAVQGVTEDDFRFKARVLFGGTPVFDEVVADDAIAVRLLDTARLPELIDQKKAAGAETKTDIDGITVTDALLARRWVIDATGAPSPTAARQAKDIGIDPVLDSRTVLDYVEQAVTQSDGVELYDKESINPVYSRAEDTFEKPNVGSRIKRYDLRRPRFPSFTQQASGGQAAVPQTKHFRKMAVYIQNGRIVKLVEKVELTGKFIDDTVRYIRAALKETKASQQVVNQFETTFKTVPHDALGAAILAGLNQQLQAFGQAPILVRTMALDNRDLGGVNQIVMPSGSDVIRGSLFSLITTGQPVVSKEEATTSTTTAAP